MFQVESLTTMLWAGLRFFTAIERIRCQLIRLLQLANYLLTAAIIPRIANRFILPR